MAVTPRFVNSCVNQDAGKVQNDYPISGPSEAFARTPRRGRPLASETARRDAHILAVAEQLFLRFGYRQVSLARIAKSAQTATRTIYARFGGKHGMLARIIDKRKSDQGYANSLMAATPDARMALHWLAVHAFEHQLAGRTSVGVNPDHIGALHTGSWHLMLAAVFDANHWRLGTRAVTDSSILVDFFIGCLLRARAAGDGGSDDLQPDAAFQLADEAVLRFFTVVNLTSELARCQTR